MYVLSIKNKKGVIMKKLIIAVLLVNSTLAFAISINCKYTPEDFDNNSYGPQELGTIPYKIVDDEGIVNERRIFFAVTESTNTPIEFPIRDGYTLIAKRGIITGGNKYLGDPLGYDLSMTFALVKEGKEESDKRVILDIDEVNSSRSKYGFNFEDVKAKKVNTYGRLVNNDFETRSFNGEDLENFKGMLIAVEVECELNY